ncbi:hypothetical protein POM88_049955 [Heracleum sosnowskyi]|uniref:Uncharacterized protein n=1 Tax=Heracleum sosnowskyi TaxID=360622 RepID=A0AAD8GYT6_9APIA|nr:hypothetical protein POM88_049955 [Heracleum sosnowskyi]
MFKGAEHRAVTNSREARTTIASFMGPCNNCIIEPAKALTSEGNLPQYKAFQYQEFLRSYVASAGYAETALMAYKFSPYTHLGEKDAKQDDHLHCYTGCNKCLDLLSWYEISSSQLTSEGNTESREIFWLFGIKVELAEVWASKEHNADQLRYVYRRMAWCCPAKSVDHRVDVQR